MIWVPHALPRKLVLVPPFPLHPPPPRGLIGRPSISSCRLYSDLASHKSLSANCSLNLLTCFALSVSHRNLSFRIWAPASQKTAKPWKPRSEKQRAESYSEPKRSDTSGNQIGWGLRCPDPRAHQWIDVPLCVRVSNIILCYYFVFKFLH